MEGKSVMYIGSKPRKEDRVNHQLKRVWMGCGFVVTDIPAVQAANLCRHADEFIDVTGLDDEQLGVKAAEVQSAKDERLRLARSHTRGSGGGVLLQYATEEQIYDELQRRKRAAHIPQPGEAPAGEERPRGPLTEQDETGGNQGGVGKPASDDDQKVAQAVQEAISEIAERGNETDFDDNGIPTLEAVQGELGYAISEDEYHRALGDDAPAAVGG